MLFWCQGEADTNLHPAPLPEGITEGEELSILITLCAHNILFLPPPPFLYAVTTISTFS